MTTGILLINLGTPDGCDRKAVRRYLREFLSDPRVIHLPWVIRWPLVNLLITPFRTKSSTEAYHSIWTDRGSPLLLHSLELAEKVQHQLGEDFLVKLAMRYGKPSIKKAVEALANSNCEKIIIVPLFPQYSSAATGSAIEETLNQLKGQWNFSDIVIKADFYQHPGFINAQAQLIRNALETFKPDLLLFSYHGLPDSHVAKSDAPGLQCPRPASCPPIGNNNRHCYRAQCYATSRALAAALGLTEENYQVSFQSRLGKTPWIKPYTDQILSELAKQGIKKIALCCPSFVADCLETIEEIGIRAREQWIAEGGEALALIPCVNASPLWISGLCDLIQEHTIRD